MVTMRAAMITAKWRSFASRHFSGVVINFLDGHAKCFKDSFVTNGTGTYEVPTGDNILE